MGRPKLQHRDNLIGTLKILDRLHNTTTKHARFRYVCTVCDYKGEADGRYLSRGCPGCRTAPLAALPIAQPDNLQVSTPIESYSITKLQLLRTLREQKHALFYYKGIRVKVEETEYDIRFSQPAVGGVEAWVALDKMSQELGEHSIVKPDFDPNAEPATADPWTEPPALGPKLDTAPEPEPTKPSTQFVPPEGAIKLEFEDDKKWLNEYYEEKGKSPPGYLSDWMDAHPDGSHHRFIPDPNGGAGYAAFTPPPSRAKLIDYGLDEPVLTPAEVEAQRLKSKKQEDSWLAQQIDDYAEKALHDPRARGNLAELAKRSSQAKEKLDAIMAKLYPASDTNDVQPFKLVSVKTKESSSEV